MKNILFVRHAVLALGLLMVGQAYAAITFSFFGRTWGKKVNTKLQNIDKECAVLSDLLLAANQVFEKDGVIDLFAAMDLSKNRPRKAAATKIKKEFDAVLKNISIEALNNATEQERMEFVSSLAIGVNSVLEFHNIIAPICKATLHKREQIVADKKLLQSAQDFFVYVVKPIEDTMNLLVDLAQNEHAMKLISEVVPNLAGIKGQIAISLEAYNSLNIRQGWTLWDIAKWSAAGAATAGVAYYVYKNSDNLSERMNNLITSAKTYRPTWSGFKTSLSSAAARVGGVYSSAKMKLFGGKKSSQQEKTGNTITINTEETMQQKSPQQEKTGNTATINTEETMQQKSPLQQKVDQIKEIDSQIKNKKSSMNFLSPSDKKKQKIELNKLFTKRNMLEQQAKREAKKLPESAKAELRGSEEDPYFGVPDWLKPSPHVQSIQKRREQEAWQAIHLSRLPQFTPHREQMKELEEKLRRDSEETDRLAQRFGVDIPTLGDLVKEKDDLFKEKAKQTN